MRLALRFAVTALVALCLAVVAWTALPAQAHTPTITVECGRLTVHLENYPTGTQLSVDIGNVPGFNVYQETFFAFRVWEKTWEVDKGHQWIYGVTIHSPDSDRYDLHEEGYIPACDTTTTTSSSPTSTTTIPVTTTTQAVTTTQGSTSTAPPAPTTTVSQPTPSTTSPQSSSTTGELPYTGVPLLLLGGFAGLLILAGIGVVVRSRA